MWYLLALIGVVLIFLGFMPSEFSTKYETNEKSWLMIGLGLFITLFVFINTPYG